MDCLLKVSTACWLWPARLAVSAAVSCTGTVSVPVWALVPAGSSWTFTVQLSPWASVVPQLPPVAMLKPAPATVGVPSVSGPAPVLVTVASRVAPCPAGTAPKSTAPSVPLGAWAVALSAAVRSKLKLPTPRRP